MKIADLYIRVSTDEQADKGYSQRDQEERLIRYCETNNITIRRIIFEDHSAKTFIRPEWQKHLSLLKQSKNRSNLILFTKWDRFSRNAPDAYNMIAILRKHGIEPQAIEQPLDLDVPENKMMLAIYLTAPEIENDRRGLNTFYGIRRARKEGRWPGLAPVGYINRTEENGRKIIVPDGKQAEHLRWAFKEISKGNFSTEQIYKRAVEKGLRCSKNNFLRSIRNPIYSGYINVPRYKDEEAFVVRGVHEALITSALFHDVQDILNGRKKSIKTKIATDEEIPLKGFLLCPRCNRTLCGSASKGRTNYYYYYHCSSKCGYRYKAAEINGEMITFLSEHKVNQTLSIFLKEAILEEFANNTQSAKERKAGIIKQLSTLQNKLTKARELLLNGDIESSDYRIIKQECDEAISQTEFKLEDINSKVYSVERLEPIINRALTTLTSLDIIYCKSTSEEKRKLIGSMFPEKITFENLKHRTAKTSEPFNYIYLINSNLSAKKTGQKTLKNLLPREG